MQCPCNPASGRVAGAAAYNPAMSSTAATASFKQDATVISLVGFAHGTSHFYHLMLPPLFPWFMQEYALSYTQVGALMTVFFVVSGIGQALAGFLVDRWGAHRVLCMGVATLAASGLLLAIAPGLWGLYVAAFGAGLGNSVFHPADFALLNHRVSQARLGHAFSVHGLSGNLGWAAAPIVMLAVATAFGWRAAGVAAAGVGLISLMLLWLKRDVLADELSRGGVGGADAVGADAKAPAQTSGIAGLLRVRLVWFAFSFFFFSTVVFGALQNFAPSLLRDLYGLSLTVATSALTAYLLGSSAGIATGGFLAGGDKRGQERLVSAVFFFAALLALLLATAIVPGWSVIAIMAVMGFGIGLAGPSRDMLVRKATAARLGTGSFGRVYGLVYSGLDVGLATSPLIFGALLDAGQPKLVFVGMACALILAIFAAQAIAGEARAAEHASADPVR
jgi:FSR family fosmidomycin resistance protein-like MFS transporter